MFIRLGIHLFPGLSVQLFVGDVEFLEVNGDEVSEIGGSVNHVVHCGNRISDPDQESSPQHDFFTLPVQNPHRRFRLDRLDKAG